MIINFYFDIIWESKVTALLLDGVSPELYLWNPKLFWLLKRDFFLSSWKMILTSVCVVIWDANSFTWTDNVVQCNINEVQILIVIFYIHQSFFCYCIFFLSAIFLIASIVDIQDTFVETGGVATLSALLFSPSPRVMQEAAVALYSIVSDSDQNKHAVIRDQGLDDLAHAARDGTIFCQVSLTTSSSFVK